MKKKTLFFLVIFVAVFLAGCAKTQTLENQVQNATKKVADKVGSPFTSIKDALSKSLSLQCTFSDDQGRQTKTYIKNGAVRTDITAAKPEDSQSVIIKDKKVYFWNLVTKKGMVMEMPEVSLTPVPTVSGTPKKSISQGINGQEFIAGLEKFKDSCKAGVVDDSLFVPPSDVEFSDLSKLIKTIPTGVPTGTGSNPAFNQEQIQKMIQQYAPDSSDN